MGRPHPREGLVQVPHPAWVGSVRPPYRPCHRDGLPARLGQGGLVGHGPRLAAPRGQCGAAPALRPHRARHFCGVAFAHTRRRRAVVHGARHGHAAAFRLPRGRAGVFCACAGGGAARSGLRAHRSWPAVRAHLQDGRPRHGASRVGVCYLGCRVDCGIAHQRAVRPCLRARGGDARGRRDQHGPESESAFGHRAGLDHNRLCRLLRRRFRHHRADGHRDTLLRVLARPVRAGEMGHAQRRDAV